MPTKKTTTRGPKSERDYIAIAREYSRKVVAGEISTCKWVRLACERQIADLARKDWHWRFNEDRAAKICRFAENLPHVKGKWSSPNLTLEAWQVFILTTVFGWVDAEGNRRFRTSYTEIPRKNGKSFLSAAVALYMLTADEEPGAEVYSAATTRDQSKVVFAECGQEMARKSEGFRRRYGVDVTAHAIAVPSTASSFKALSADGSTLDGLNVHCAVIDELHAHKTREVFDVINSATGSRQQPLIWLITTAGFNRSGVCYEQREYVRKILERIHEDETYFGIVYSIDDGDDWTDEESWRKANPNYGISVLEKDIAVLARQAMLSAQSQNNFLTKRLNVWVNADTSWMNMQAWDACKDESLQIEDFEGQECWIAVDLATKIDIAATMFMFPRGNEVVVFGKYYLPEAAVEAGVNTNAAHYAGWANEGLMTLTPGDVTDFETIQDDIYEGFRRFSVYELVFDPACQAQDIANRLQRLGIKPERISEVPVRTGNVSTPMKELEALVLQKRLKHNGDPVLAWMASNVVAKQDERENIFPRKERPENKIDGIVAMILGLKRILEGKPKKPSVYETRGLITSKA